METSATYELLPPRRVDRQKRQSYSAIHDQLRKLRSSGKWLPIKGPNPDDAGKLARTLQQLYREEKSPEWRLERLKDDEPGVVLIRLVKRGGRP